MKLKERYTLSTDERFYHNKTKKQIEYILKTFGAWTFVVTDSKDTIVFSSEHYDWFLKNKPACKGTITSPKRNYKQRKYNVFGRI